MADHFCSSSLGIIILPSLHDGLVLPSQAFLAILCHVPVDPIHVVVGMDDTSRFRSLEQVSRLEQYL